MSQIFEVVIFTAAAQDYADFILNYIQKDIKFIDHRLYRQHCQYEDGIYVKDLSLLGRDLSKTIIVDNIRDNFERQPGNGIEILTWLHDPSDRELYKLSIFLKNIVTNMVSDVRDHIKTYTEEMFGKNRTPSKRSFINTKMEAEDCYSPIRSNKKGERYSGTPHHQKISPTKMKVATMINNRPKL